MTAAAVARIVVQATPQEKKEIVAKARKLGVPVAELMRRGAIGYAAADDQAQLDALADAAKNAAERASAAIDDALAFIAASEKRMAATAKRPAKASRKG